MNPELNMPFAKRNKSSSDEGCVTWRIRLHWGQWGAVVSCYVGLCIETLQKACQLCIWQTEMYKMTNHRAMIYPSGVAVSFTRLAACGVLDVRSTQGQCGEEREETSTFCWWSINRRWWGKGRMDGWKKKSNEKFSSRRSWKWLHNIRSILPSIGTTKSIGKINLHYLSSLMVKR